MGTGVVMVGKNKAVRSLRSGLFSALDRAMPHISPVDRLFLLARFLRAHKRFPRNPARSNATFNDLIFNRLSRRDWTSLERFCVDKEYVKSYAQGLCSGLRVAATIDIIRASDRASIEATLRARLGDSLVAKPTHASGMILFLKKRPADADIRHFARDASQSYYRRSRESLYAGLEHKVVFEEDLSEFDTVPVDYKFFCARGEVFFCQVDVDRFHAHTRALVSPTFEPIDVSFMYDAPPALPIRPERFEDMVAMARKLSSAFSFVRVDLYCVRGAIYFGELTFAPEAGAGSLSSEAFGGAVMAGIRRANARRDIEAQSVVVNVARPPAMDSTGHQARDLQPEGPSV